MAMFTYVCENEECEVEEFDHITRISLRDEPQICPECGNEECLRRKIVRTNFKLTGQGFYATDYGASTINPKDKS